MDQFQIERLTMSWTKVEALIHNYNNANGNIDKEINYHQLIIIK